MDIELPYYKLKTPQKQKTHYNTPDVARMSDILRVTHGTSLEVPILLSAWLSLRRGEICGLTWDDIDGDYLHIRKSRVFVNGTEYVKSTKTVESDREVYLPKYIKERMYESRKIKTRSPEYVDLRKTSPYIVPMKPDTLSHNFTKMLKRHNLPLCRFHDLRHAFASIGMSLNIPNKYLEVMGGWSDDTTLKNVYQQTFKDSITEYSKQIEAVYMTIIPAQK